MVLWRYLWAVLLFRFLYRSTKQFLHGDASFPGNCQNLFARLLYLLLLASFEGIFDVILQTLQLAKVVTGQIYVRH